MSVEEITPHEVDADTGFISNCQNYLKNCDNALAMYGKLGSGKRTLAAQVAIRLARKDKKLKIKIVREREVLSKDLQTVHSTILVIHDPIKTWYTTRKTEEIISYLLTICTSASKNNCYIIAIFHCNDWNSLRLQLGKKNATIEQMFPKKTHIFSRKQKLTEIAMSNKVDISNVAIQQDGASIGSSIILTLFLKNCAYQNHNFLSNPTMFIFKKLKTLEGSSDINDQIAFKILVYIILHDGIDKLEFGGVSHHALFADLKEKMNTEGSIDGYIEQLLGVFIEKMADGQSYRILHDVITRCTFLAAVENHKAILFSECDPILIFDCIRLKLRREKITCFREMVLDHRNLKIALPTEMYPEIARLFYQRSDIKSVLWNSILFDDENFQIEWNKAELYFTKDVKKCNG